jgi:hypothetical protein
LHPWRVAGRSERPVKVKIKVKVEVKVKVEAKVRVKLKFNLEQATIAQGWSRLIVLLFL